MSLTEKECGKKPQPTRDFAPSSPRSHARHDQYHSSLSLALFTPIHVPLYFRRDGRDRCCNAPVERCQLLSVPLVRRNSDVGVL